MWQCYSYGFHLVNNSETSHFSEYYLGMVYSSCRSAMEKWSADFSKRGEERRGKKSYGSSTFSFDTRFLALVGLVYNVKNSNNLDDIED